MAVTSPPTTVSRFQPPKFGFPCVHAQGVERATSPRTAARFAYPVTHDSKALDGLTAS